MAPEKKFQLHLPSTLGCEKVAMDFAASVAKSMNFPADRVEDLKTAVAEACTNAIEHGNKLDASMKVGHRDHRASGSPDRDRTGSDAQHRQQDRGEERPAWLGHLPHREPDG